MPPFQASGRFSEQVVLPVVCWALIVLPSHRVRNDACLQISLYFKVFSSLFSTKSIIFLDNRSIFYTKSGKILPLFLNLLLLTKTAVVVVSNCLISSL